MGTDTGVPIAPLRAAPSCPRPPLLGREEPALSEHQPRPERENPIDEAVADLIRWKARSLVGRAGLTTQDREDLEQELILRVLAPLAGYDPARGPRLAYARTLIDRYASNLLRARRAAKRASGPLVPLPDDLPAPDVSADAALDVSAALARAPEHSRAAARQVMLDSPTAAARILGVSRATVYARVRDLGARAEFRALAEILPTSPDTSRANRE